MKKITTIKQKVVYENNYVTIYDDDVLFPSGQYGKYYRSQWKAPHGAAIVVTFGSEILLINNYRYNEQSHVFEIPQGFGELNESPISTAARELLEETGIKVDERHLSEICTFGIIFKTHVFHCNLQDMPDFCNSNADSSEVIYSHRWIDTSEDISLKSNVAVSDPLTAYCIMYIKSIS